MLKKRLNFAENSTPLGAGLASIGVSVVAAGLDLLSREANLVGLLLVVAGLVAVGLGSLAAWRPDPP